jgi:hypothetical protein
MALQPEKPAAPVSIQPEQPAGSARWVWLSLLPFGLGAWAPSYAGTVMRKRRWFVLGLVWSIITLAGWILATINNGGAAGGLFIILGWAGAIATSFAIRGSYLELTRSPFQAALAGAEERLSERDQARKLALDRPQLAKELGIGRPDLQDAHDAGLIDINNAPASILSKLPGIDDALATKIVEARAEVHGFASVEDLGAALDLDGHTVEDLRDRVVFLPR